MAENWKRHEGKGSEHADLFAVPCGQLQCKLMRRTRVQNTLCVCAWARMGITRPLEVTNSTERKRLPSASLQQIRSHRKLTEVALDESPGTPDCMRESACPQLACSRYETTGS